MHIIDFKLLTVLLAAVTVVGCSRPQDTESLTRRVEALEAQNAALQGQIDYIGLQLSQVQTSFKVLEAKYADLKLVYGEDVPELQSELNILQLQIAVLQGYKAIVSFEDPCGDGPGYDEILLRTSDGTVVAYFESGNDRFLTKLEPDTQYRTTDKQNCKFMVDAAGNLL